ncbi:hypothetical protein F511_12216 [Dorcoceras hygrometricum]|uniref:Uncharacterized protein n=1 Tax=Dorcoceras hygrometricum TaxID=472368 RepID=A0A2Z7B3V9_9LAMI|nr:hypothetical protein F511_12216 [Dorcoceras hygrometricum]
MAAAAAAAAAAFGEEEGTALALGLGSPSLPPLQKQPPPPPPPCAAAASLRRKIVPGQLDEENPSAQISSGLLVQADEGVSNPVVDLIGVIYRSLP